MKEKIQENLKGILGDLYNSADFDIKEFDINIQENKEKEHGDLASNIALVLANTRAIFDACLLYTSPSPRDA